MRPVRNAWPAAKTPKEETLARDSFDKIEPFSLEVDRWFICKRQIFYTSSRSVIFYGNPARLITSTGNLL